MKKSLFLIGVLSILSLLGSYSIGIQPAGAFSGGNGTQGSPWQIADCDDLQEIDDEVDRDDDYFELTGNIDCVGVDLSPLSFGEGYFRGVLDGNNFTISNLEIEDPLNDDMALFDVSIDATFLDLNVANPTIVGSGLYISVLSAYAQTSTFTNITVTSASVTAAEEFGAYIGGLVGNSTENVYSNVSMDVVIDASLQDSVGGIAGRSYEDRILDTIVTTDSEINGRGDVGGIAGYSESSEFDGVESGAAVNGDEVLGGAVGKLIVIDDHAGFMNNTRASGDISGLAIVGGLIGETTDDLNSDNTYAITNSSASGAVEGFDEVGGFIGTNRVADISTSYATGDVSGVDCECSDIGGFAGRNADGENYGIGSITQSFSTGDVNAVGGLEVGGFIGDISEGEVADSYARGNVIGSDGVGGFLGEIDDGGNADRTYSTGTVTADSNAGGHSGIDNDGFSSDSFWDEEASGTSASAYGTGLTTAQAKTQSTFTDAGWDFSEVWSIDPGVNDGYPCLQFKDGCDPIDGDGDGIDDSVEDNAPNGGDANGDGIPDSQQANVSSFISDVTEQYVVVALDDTCTIESADVQDSRDNSVEDIAFTYPVGMMNFTAQCNTTSTNVELRFFNLEDSEFVARKYNPNNESYFTIENATVSEGLLDGLKFVSVAYTVDDNGDLDINSEEGTITDPAGLGQQLIGAPRTGAGGTFGGLIK